MKSKILNLILVVAFFFVTNAKVDAQGTWVQKANYGGAGRYWSCGFTVGNIGYIGPGYNGGQPNDVWGYDPTTDSWTQVASYPGAGRLYVTGFSVGNKGYLGCGWNGAYNNDFWEYDPAGNTWTVKASFPGGGRWGAVGFGIGTKGYIGTGDECGNGNCCQTDFWEWDQTTNIWTQKTSFPGAAVYGGVGFAIGSKGYIGTGYSSSTNTHAEFYEYDPGTDSWTQKANFGGSARYQDCGFVIGTTGYIGTGSGGQDVWGWDQNTNIWTQVASFPGSASQVLVGLSIGSNGYMGTGDPATQAFYEFEPPCTAATPVITANGSTTICQGSSVVLDAGTYVSYSWSDGSMAETDTMFNVGTYTVTVTDGSGCTGTASQAITVNPNPTPTITQAGSMLDVGVYVSYLWNTGATTEMIHFAVSGAYSVTVTDANGCTGMASINASTSLAITTGAIPSPICAGSTITVAYSLAYTYNPSNVFRAELSDSSGSFTTLVVIGVLADSVSGSITATIPVNAGGTHYRIRVIASSPAAIGSDNGADIIIGALPHPIISHSTPVNFCAGGSVTLNAGAWNTYLWNTGATTSTITANTAGTYSVTVSSAIGCTGTTSQAVVAYSLPLVSFSGITSPVCSNAGEFALTGSPTGGHFSGSGVTNSDFNPNNLSGVVSVTYTYTDTTHGCTNSSMQSITVNSITNDVLTQSSAPAFCQGHSDTLTSMPYASYLWNTGATTDNIIASVSGTYSITATDANGCTTTASQLITVYSFPSVSFTGLPTTVCSDAGLFALTGIPADGNFSGSGVINSNFNPSNLSGNYNITYSYTDPTHGCVGTATNSVLVNPIATVVITASGATSFCNGDSVNLSAGIYESYLWNTGATTSSIYATVSGTYMVTVTSANGCTGMASKAVTVYSLPVVSFSGLPTTVCSNAGFIALTGNPVGGHFTGSGITNSNFNPNNLSGNYTITYTYTDTVHGCVGTTTHNVTVNPFPTVVLTFSGAASFCQGGSVTIDAGPYVAYSWNSGQTTESITANVAGTYIVTATDVNGCTGTASQAVTVHALPVVSFSGLPASVCSNAANIPLTGTPSGGHFSGIGVNNSDFNPYNLSGNYTVTYSYLDTTTGCSNSISHNITVNPIPNVVIIPTGATSFCTGDNVTLNAGIYASYLWSTGATTGSITVSTQGTFTVTVTSANGCTGTASISTTVYANPVVTFILPASVCADAAPIALTGSPTGGHFTGTGITNSTFNPNNLIGTFTITYTYIDPVHGCSGSISHSITVNPFTNVVIASTGADTICQGGSETLSVGTYSSYHWSTGATTNSIVVSTSGTYSVTATAADGCTGMASHTIVVNQLPVVNFSGLPANVCASAGNITLVGSPVGGAFYGDGMTGNIFNPVNLQNGNDTITYFYTNPVTGCSNTSVQHTTVGNVNVTITSSGPTVICNGGSVTLSVGSFNTYHWSTGNTTNSITVNTVGINTYTVTVTAGNGCNASASQTVTIYATTPVSFSGLPASVCSNQGNIQLTGSPAGGLFSGAGINGTMFNPTNLANGTYVITYGYNDANSCYNSATQSVTVTNVNPTMSFVSGQSAFCANLSATITPGVYSTYHWSTGASTSSITVNTVGTNVYSVTITGGAGCTGIASDTITVYPLPIVSFTGLPSSTCSDAGLIALTGNHVGGSFSGTGVVGNHFSPNNLSGTYTVTYTYADSIHGCVNTATNSITVNTFTNVVITTNHSSTFCAGDSVTLNAGNYSSYLWSNALTTNTITVSTSGNYTVTCTAANGCTGTASKVVTVNSLPTVNFTGIGAHICSDTGIIILTGSPLGGNFNGTGMSHDTLNPQNIPSGTITITYSYTDTTTGCSNSFVQNVGVSNVDPTISANSALQFCAGGSVTLTAAASNTAYHWSNGASTQSTTVNTSAVYLVTVTGLYGCTRTNTDTVIVYPLPVITFNITPSSVCSNAPSVTLTATPAGGVFGGPHVNNNSFDPIGLTGLQTLTYYFLDTTHGCSNTASSTITVNAFPTFTMHLTHGNHFCEGTIQTMTAVGSFANYSWNTGATTSSITTDTTGIYIVTVTAANGCTGTKTDTTQVLPLPVVSFTGLPTHDTCQLWGYYPLVGTPAGGNYYGTGLTIYTGDTVFNPFYANVGTDTVTYYYTDSHGCTGFARNTVVITNCTGIPEILMNNGMEIFPNPNDGNFTLKYNLTLPNATLDIVDVTGRTISTFEIKGTAGNQTINTDLSNGIYFWELINANGITAKGKISITK